MKFSGELLNDVDDRILKQERLLEELHGLRAEIMGSDERLVIHYTELIQESESFKHEWLIGGLIPAESIGVLVADPKVGKSTLATQIALSLGKGWNVFGMRVVKPRKVLYLFAEGARALVAARMKACAAKMDISEPPPFFVQAKQFTEFSARGAGLKSIIEREKPDLAILDTLSIFWHGDENSQEDWKKNVLIPLRRLGSKFGTSFMLIHHQSKASPDRQGWQKLRGTGAIFADVDWFMRLETDDAEPADPAIRRLIVDKSKFGPDDFHIRLRFLKPDAYFEPA